MRLVIRVDKDFQGRIDKRWLRRLVKESLGAHSAGAEVELSLLITDDATVRELNKKYRGKDKTTDVLSFALEVDQPRDAATGFVMPPGEKVHLGEVIVSYPKADEQAAERNHAGYQKNRLSSRPRRFLELLFFRWRFSGIKAELNCSVFFHRNGCEVEIGVVL